MLLLRGHCIASGTIQSRSRRVEPNCQRDMSFVPATSAKSLIPCLPIESGSRDSNASKSYSFMRIRTIWSCGSAVNASLVAATYLRARGEYSRRCSKLTHNTARGQSCCRSFSILRALGIGMIEGPTDRSVESRERHVRNRRRASSHRIVKKCTRSSVQRPTRPVDHVNSRGWLNRNTSAASKASRNHFIAKHARAQC